MRGGFIHRCVMLGALDADISSKGGQTVTEFATRVSDRIGYIDLVARYPGLLLAIEAELSSRRVGRDLSKAIAIGADELWIVVPTAHLAQAVRRRVHEMGRTAPRPAVFVLTLGQARQRVSDCFQLNSGANAQQKKNNHRARG